jgi:hypothetical protein
MVGLVFFGAGTARASSVVYSLNNDHCTGTCGTSPFGTVTLNDFGGSGDVQVTVDLFNGDRFVHTGFPGSFGFDLIGNPTISLSGVSTGWSLLSTTAGALHFDGFGNLEYALTCDACGSGGSHPVAPPLKFDVLAAGLTIASFAEASTGGDPTYFVADIRGNNQNTGPVGGLTPIATVPEPASFLLVGSGLVAAWRNRRRRATRPQ